MNNLIPIQVIKNVDMVKGKTTLIRATVVFNSAKANDTITPNVTIYWNNLPIAINTTHTMFRGETQNFDFWYVPTATGTNVQVKAVVNGTSTEGFAFND